MVGVTFNGSAIGSMKKINSVGVVKKISDGYVLIDTPPLGSVIDAAIVSRQCDGVALVIASGEVSYKFAQQVKAQLEMSDCKILGVIMNKVNMESGKGYYGKYYGK